MSEWREPLLREPLRRWQCRRAVRRLNDGLTCFADAVVCAVGAVQGFCEALAMALDVIDDTAREAAVMDKALRDAGMKVWR